MDSVKDCCAVSSIGREGEALIDCNLTVAEDNDVAINLYLRFGFKPTGDRMPLREGSHVQCLSLRLDI
jgi:ribosomal protein S18 acetylase RimI-like enzyme